VGHSAVGEHRGALGELELGGNERAGGSAEAVREDGDLLPLPLALTEVQNIRDVRLEGKVAREEVPLAVARALWPPLVLFGVEERLGRWVEGGLGLRVLDVSGEREPARLGVFSSQALEGGSA